MNCNHRPQGICIIEGCHLKCEARKCKTCGKPRWRTVCGIHRPDGSFKPRRRGRGFSTSTSND